jgi:methionyl-tRNA formyltransferase
LAKALMLLVSKRLPPEVPQEDELATYAHKLKKQDGLIDWNQPSAVIERKLRAYTPWPGSYTFLPMRFRKKDSGRLVVLGVEFAAITPAQRSELPGTVIDITPRGPVVRTADKALLLVAVKPEGAKEMDGGSFLRGRELKPLTDMFLSK